MKKQGVNYHRGMFSTLKLLIYCSFVLTFVQVPYSSAQFHGGGRSYSQTAKNFYLNAMECLRKGDTDTAIRFLRDATTIDASMIDAHYQLGLLYMEKGQYANAENCFYRITRLSPGNKKARDQMAICKQRQSGSGRYDRYNRNPTPSTHHNQLSLHNRGISARQVAPSLSLSPQSTYIRSARYNPAISMYNQGLTKHKQGRIRDAISYYQRALAVDRNIRDLQYNLGLAYLSQQRYTDAEHCFSEVLRINPNDSAALERLNQIAGRTDGGQYQSRNRIATSTTPAYQNRFRDRIQSTRDSRSSYARRQGSRQDITPSNNRISLLDQTVSKPVSFPSDTNKSSSTASVTPIRKVAPPVVKPVENKAKVFDTTIKKGRVADTKVGDKWALVIGISKFKNSKYDLVYAAKDARDFYNFLVKEANFKQDHVKLLLDQQATRAKIMGAFGSSWLPRMTEPGDLVVVYVSTHGTPKDVDNGGRNYIVAHDTDAEDLYPTGVDMDEIYRRIKEGVKTDRVLIVLDTCYSGSAIPGSRALVRNTNFDLSQVKLGRGHLVISSSSPGERSWESKRYQNGVFTHQLINALRANNKKVDVKQAFEKMKKKVSWEVKCDYGKKQTPQFGGDWKGSDLILSVPPSNPRSLGPQSQ